VKEKISQYELMTTTSVPHLVVKLSIPTVISMLVTTIYNMVDTAFVGHLGNSASGAVGVVFGATAILQAIAFMFGQGGGSLMARSLGHKDADAANSYASTAFFLALITALLLSVLGILFLPRFVILLGSTKTIQPFAEDYCLWIMLGAPFIVCSHVMNNLLRYEGKATLAMFALLTGAALNIALDPLLILVFEMGVAGAGLATAFSQMVGFFILLSIFRSGKTQSRLSPRFVLRDIRKIFDMAFTGFPSLIRQGLNSGCTITLNNLIRAGGYGDPAISAMSIVSRIVFFVFASGLGIGQGFQPISSFNYGAGKYTRVRKAFFWTLGIATGMIAVMCTACLCCSGTLISLFRDDPKVIEIGTRALILQCVAMYFQSFGMVTEMLFQSTGKKLGASILSTFRCGGFFLLFLLILAPLRGLAGIQEAQPLANFCATLIAIPFAIAFLKKLPKEDLSE